MKIILLLAALGWSEETASFLKVGIGARALGMGGAHTAVADDVNAVGWNPAGLAGLTQRQLGVTHAELIGGARYENIGFAQPSRHGTFGASGSHLSYGSLEGRDGQGRATGGFTAADSAVALSYARSAAGLQLGGSLKLIQSRIAAASGEAVAVDLGARRQLAAFGPGVPMLGLAVQNAGSGMRLGDQTAQLPLTLAAGAGYRLPFGLLIAADFKHRPHSREKNELSVGTEYALLAGFAVRGGYVTNRSAETGAAGTTSPLAGVAAGFGVRLYGYNLDYSMTPMGELGSVQRFSLTARF